MTKYNKGDKVKDQYGNIWEVMKHIGCQVFVYKSGQNWFHPTKIFKLA